VTEVAAEADDVDEVDDVEEVVDAAYWALLAAYCCRAERNSDSSWTPSVEAVALADVLLVDVLLVDEALLVELTELVELVLDAELAEALASGGGGPPSW